MPFSRVAETRIREAIEQGDFDNLPGAGKPLNLEEYFSSPEELRMAFAILKNANCAPAEVELLKEVSRLQQALAETSDPAAKREFQRTLADRQTELAIAFERRSPRER
jgi:DnaJ-like protein